MMLDRTSFVQPSFGGDVGVMRFLLSLKNAYVTFATILRLNARYVFALVGANSEQLCHVPWRCFAPILQVYLSGYIPEIRKRIVMPQSVDMVDVVDRHVACHIEPDEPMREIFAPIYCDVDVPKLFVHRPNMIRQLGSFTRHKPSKYSGIFIVVKAFFKPRLSENTFSHDAVLSQSGQKPGRVAIAFPASSF